ncbi:hypothetical protein V2J09_011107 [Rumex salicifolius]
MPAPRVMDPYKDKSSHYHHRRHLDFQSVEELPDAYEWGPLEAHGGPAEEPGGVPIVDLQGPNTRELIGSACKSWGAFQVINHGVPQRVLEEVESAGRSLFSLPLHQKLKAARAPDRVTGYGPARISSFFPKLLWSEGFTIFGSPEDHARQLWPQDYHNFCEIIEEYDRDMKKLAGRLMWLVLGSLGIANDDVEWAGPTGDFNDTCLAALQLNSYPKCPNPGRAMGLAAHTDSTILTILYQNNATGLQVHRDGLGWVTVPPVPGALVVNIGDLLHILSNGLYPSVLHRAVVNRTHHRLSVAYLFGPPQSVRISPLQRLVDPDHPALYRPISWTEYLSTKAKYFNKALSSVRLAR